MNFQERLFDLRRQVGLSQEQLADLVGVTRQAVQKWEAGTSRPDMDNLTTLAGYFQVSLDYLVTGREFSHNTPATKDVSSSPPEPAATVIHHYYHNRWHYEYKSKRTLFGLPLVHINCGPGIHWARGVIAIGDIATGLVALGGVAVGLVSLGALSLGLLLALGALSLGIVSIGGLAVGLTAWGGFAFGLLSVGGISCGVYAAGGVACASKVAVGGVASAPLAIGAAVEGAQTILIPPEGLTAEEADAVRSIIETACQGAPGFIPWLLKLFLFAEAS